MENYIEDYNETTYGERIADVYDELYVHYDETAVGLLQELARGGRALELGIGTGRLALPLQQCGIDVTGIDASPSMVARLREKPGGSEIEVTQASFAEFELADKYDLIYIVANTFFALLTQDEQVQCFQSVAGHLVEEGLFLLEVFVPDLGRFEDGQTLRTSSIEDGRAILDASKHDPVSQQVTSQHIFLSEEGVRLFPVKLRYAWPSELDLMARLAGLSLRHRWSSWSKDPFIAGSGRHISVYGRGGASGE